MSKKPNVLSSKVVYKGFFKVIEDVLERNDGKTGIYTSVHLEVSAAIILAKDTEGRWILNREYRHPINNFILGCPGGRMEPGEDPFTGAQRELFEETGYWSDEIQLIGESYQCPAVTDQKISFFYAPNAKFKGNQHLDPLEYIETRLFTDEELQRTIHSGIPIDGSVCTALWLWKSRP
ncbi:MAG: NUDIX hydrolase [Verrucomicrobia bacterium]|nr:NUDIX hydrolase [Verrucomicrobiota bacterium]